ncbi:thioredoxin family protein [Clostridium thermarum]|uniref:thioredoxin family protein n=1 Tax=Clostridium thermarum TaxID=1716543 RepID=UPI001FAAF007|nr:thioredoxin family protein [Clostridium thermarum]
MNDKRNKNTVIRIAVPVILICIVAGIWFLKNNEKEKGSRPIANNSNAITDNALPNNDEAPKKNADFELHVTEKINIEKLKSYGIPIIIDFGADSCIPCKEMAPVLKELNEELQGKAIIKFVDVWKYQSLAEGYPVSLIPTQILIDAKGKPYNPKNPDEMGLTMYSLKETGEHVFTVHEGGMTKEQMLKVLKEMGLE